MFVPQQISPVPGSQDLNIDILIKYSVGWLYNEAHAKTAFF